MLNPRSSLGAMVVAKKTKGRNQNFFRITKTPRGSTIQLVPHDQLQTNMQRYKPPTGVTTAKTEQHFAGTEPPQPPFMWYGCGVCAL